MDVVSRLQTRINAIEADSIPRLFFLDAAIDCWYAKIHTYSSRNRMFKVVLDKALNLCKCGRNILIDTGLAKWLDSAAFSGEPLTAIQRLLVFTTALVVGYILRLPGRLTFFAACSFEMLLE